MSLQKIQSELKAPKGQFNNFGKYNYRNLEDIMEAIKPLLAKESMSLIIGDDIVEVAGRVYVKATARLIDKEGKEVATNTAFARETMTKKGMDEAQITGATSSYARKYCLNGLFCIDDTKDADSQDNSQHTATISDAQAREITQLINQTGSDYNKVLEYAHCKDILDMPLSKFPIVKAMLNKKMEAA